MPPKSIYFHQTLADISMPASISLANLIPDGNQSIWLRMIVKILDRVLGIHKMNRLYLQHNMASLPKEEFAKRLLDTLQISIDGRAAIQSAAPQTGPLVIASNHPFGGIEGVILCLLLGEIRKDLKVLANQGLKLFPELSDYFIFTNPLSERDPKNAGSLRASLEHVKQGGALLIFPAGRVSYYQSNKNRISEHRWNRIVAKLANIPNAHYLPLFVAGRNSPLFYRLGRVYYRMRMMMLARELLNKNNVTIQIGAGQALTNTSFNTHGSLNEQAALCRVLSYAQDPSWRKIWSPDTYTELKPLAIQTDWQNIQAELSELPEHQLLLKQKAFSVYFGYQFQLQHTVTEIARLREKVFREHNEGSGEPLDTDKFDATYTHLFVVNEEQQQIIGAYRMGQTDVLLKHGDINALYLSRMFSFSKEFVNRTQPCLELGRSFLIPEYQRSFQGLYLLWRGIGAFVCLYPRYRTLYGTVSISKLYDTRSAALIERALVTPTDTVAPRIPFDFNVHPEIVDFADEYELKPHLSALLGCIEKDGKDIPILAKHYMKLGAQFHCLGIDGSFNDTLGLLLSVELPAAPEKLLKLYMGENWQQYRDDSTI